MKINQKGFTVLEFLIVITIMAILLGLILVGFTAARKSSRDQVRVSNAQTLVVGLTQFYDICRSYPPTLDGTETCDGLAGKTLKDIIYNADSYKVNPEFHYAGLADPSDRTSCTGYHVVVTLETTATSFKGTKTGAPASATVCDGSAVDIDGTSETVFDIKK